MDASIAELLVSGFKLMLIGMGIVFFFLLLLVGVIHQTHSVMLRVETKPAKAARSAPHATSDTATDSELVAAVTAAIHQYEQRTPQHQGVSNG